MVYTILIIAISFLLAYSSYLSKLRKWNIFTIRASLISINCNYMKKVKDNLLTIGICGAIFLYASFGLDMIKTSPDHSLVFVSHQDKEFISPPCFMRFGFDDINQIKEFALVQNIVLQKRGDIKSKGYNPSADCRAKDGFTENTTAGIAILKSIGLYRAKSRWNEDGSWNY